MGAAAPNLCFILKTPLAWQTSIPTNSGAMGVFADRVLAAASPVSSGYLTAIAVKFSRQRRSHWVFWFRCRPALMRRAL
jgi:hypothetical protein